MDTQKRLQRFVREMPPEIDGALISSPINRRYYTGFASSAGALLILRKKSLFVVDSRYLEAAKAAVNGCEVLLQQKLYEQLQQLCGQYGAPKIAVEGEYTSLAEYHRMQEAMPDITLLQHTWVSEQAQRQRAVKDAQELGCIRQAQKITDNAFAYILNYIQPGRTEREIALELEFYTRKTGSEQAAFAFIAVSGKNTSLPHGVPGNKPVERGDFVTLDFGCTVEGYRSDMTRTVAVGEISEKQRAVYSTVLCAQKAALEAIAPGKICRDIDKIARDSIDASLFKGCFGHGLGHSLGLDIHESPNFNTRCEAALQPGNVLSVEPGVYLAGEFGVRIEDIIAVTQTGAENLTQSPKELIVL